MMAKLAAFADVSLSPIHRFVPVRKFPFLNSCAPPKTPEKRPCAPEDGIRKMASLTARNRLFHDIVPDFRDRPAMENRVRFSYAFTAALGHWRRLNVAILVGICEETE